MGALAAVGAYLLIGRGANAPGEVDRPVVVREANVEILGTARTSESGLPVRPPLRLTHPDGAVVEVPSSEFVFSDWVDMRRLELGEIGDGWEGHGYGWKFESRGGLTISEAITVAIPDAGAGPEGRVVALTSYGSWAEVPATRQDGTFRFNVTAVPAPWLVAVASQRPITYLPGDGPAESAAVEALYWSDRDRWLAQEQEWIAGQDLSVSMLPDSLLVSRTAAQPRTHLNVKADLDRALRLLGGARAVEAATQAATGFTIPGAASAPQSVLVYHAGITRLAGIRREWVANRYRWAAAEDSQGDTSIFRFDDAQTMDQAIESALAQYAPWGVELTEHLLRSGYLASLDLRVLAPYGETYFTDLKLQTGAVATVDDAVAKVRTTGAREESRFLRLYSTRSIEDTSWIDYFKDWKTEGFVRYAPMALWALGLTSGGPLLVGFTVADQLLTWYQDTEAVSANRELYTQVQHWETTVSAADIVVDAAAEAIRTTHVAKTAISGRTLSMGQFVYALGLSLAVANTDWFMLKDVREVTEGSRTYCIRGRCNWFYSQNIPPIMVGASVRGDAPLPNGAYPATRAKVMTWTMAFRGGTARLEGNRVVYSADLHELFRDTSGRSELWAQADTNYNLRGKDALNALSWEPYRESSWPDVLIHNTPDAQAIRLAVPETYLEAVEREFDIPAGSPIEDYGLVFVLEGPSGSGRNIFLLGHAAEPRAGDEKGVVYFSVVLSRDSALALGGIEVPYAGEIQEAGMKPLRRSLTGYLYAHAQEREEWVEIPIEFTASNPVRQVDPEDVESPRVHYVDISAEEKAALYRGTTSQGLPVEVAVDFKGKTWEIKRLGARVEDARCGEGSTRTGATADWGAMRDGAKQVPPGSEGYSAALLIRWITSGVLEGNVLAWAPVPPEVAALGTEGDPVGEIRDLWGADSFGMLDSSRRTLSGDLKIPFTDWFGCPVMRFSFTATRIQ